MSVNRSKPNNRQSTIRNVLFSLIALTTGYAQAGVTSTVLDEKAGFQAVTWTNNTVLVSGTNGSAYLSTNNGKQFTKLSLPPDTEALQFRDNQWFRDGSIVLMSAGEGAQSRLYYLAANDEKTQSTHWQLVKQGEHEHVFFDCMAFTEQGEGWLYGDSDKQGLYILHTNNSGKDWTRQVMPVTAQTSEGGFASSGTCVAAMGDWAAIGTGNSLQPGLLIKQQNQPWERFATLFEGGEAAGIFSIQLSRNTLYAFGGSLKHQHAATAFKFDTVKAEWQAMPTPALNGAIYGSALYFNSQNDSLPGVLISNPQGVYWLSPGSTRWQNISNSNIWSLACKTGSGCIGVGKGGVVEYYSPESLSAAR